MRSKWWKAVTAVGILATLGFVILAAVEDLGFLAQAVIPFVGVAFG